MYKRGETSQVTREPPFPCPIFPPSSLTGRSVHPKLRERPPALSTLPCCLTQSNNSLRKVLHSVTGEKTKTQEDQHLPTVAQQGDETVEVQSQVALLGNVWSFHPTTRRAGSHPPATGRLQALSPAESPHLPGSWFLNFTFQFLNGTIFKCLPFQFLKPQSKPNWGPGGG